MRVWPIQWNRECALSEADRQKWDQRYSAGAYNQRRYPCALLADFLPRLPRGRALDLGCGTGRNALFLAAAGYEVDAIDISSVALERARANTQTTSGKVHWIEADLEAASAAQLLAKHRYALIVMVRYVNRALVATLPDRLADGGHLLVEQHLRAPGADAGPRDPSFRLRANELLHAAGDLRVVYYREDLVQDPDGRTAALAQLIACRGAPFFQTPHSD